MKRSLVVVLAVVLCGLCCLPCNEAVPLDNLTNEVSTLVGGITNDVKGVVSTLLNGTSSLTSKLPNVVNYVNDIVKTLLESVEHIVQTVLQWVSLILSKISSLLGFDGFTNVLSYLSSAFKGLPLNPINTLREFLSSNEDNVVQIFEKHASVLVSSFKNFLITTGLPWLHNALDKIESSNNVPFVVQSIIESFNALYGVLELFGYVKA
ncbi:uncharacterized protein LOC143346759 isoform X1 [Colletes latitarsis]|uniref:uncharacterized protein LOC143346759 isoform X1 n=1 Tax=Colletes latitarsis TaxID=2605962 RepID=UPI00403731EB